MIPVYNEEDIIQEVIENMISNRIELVILDNGSSDNSYKYCESFLDKGVLELRRFATDTFQIGVVLRMLYDMAIKQSPDWVMVINADEILESGTKNLTLNEAITKADAEEYNLIQFDRFDFFMTDNDNESAKSIKDKNRYYSYLGDYLYRSWKFTPGIRADVNAAHYPIFPEGYPYKISPEKFIMRHYKFRNKEQAIKKTNDRVRGRKGSIKKNPLISELYKTASKTDFSQLMSHKKLTKYNEDNKWNYEIKNVPNSWLTPLKKEDLFTTDGFLKNPIKTTFEYQQLWEYEKLRILPRNLRRVPSFIIKKFIKKLKQ